jgi:hypothetical protein
MVTTRHLILGSEQRVKICSVQHVVETHGTVNQLECFCVLQQLGAEAAKDKADAHHVLPFHTAQRK